MEPARTTLLALFLIAVSLILLGSAAALYAEQISTTSCKAAADRTKTQDGKKYSCTSCEACTTTTCTTGGPASCTNTTTTTCSCTETASVTRPLDGVGGISPGVLDPGREIRKPRVTGVGKPLLRQ